MGWICDKCDLINPKTERCLRCHHTQRKTYNIYNRKNIKDPHTAKEWAELLNIHPNTVTYRAKGL